MHDFPLWLRTGSNPADINWFGMEAILIKICSLVEILPTKNCKLHYKNLHTTFGCTVQNLKHNENENIQMALCRINMKNIEMFF